MILVCGRVVKKFYYHFLLGFVDIFRVFTFIYFFLHFCNVQVHETHSRNPLRRSHSSSAEIFSQLTFFPLSNVYQCIFWPLFCHWSMPILASFIPLVNTCFGPFSTTDRNRIWEAFRH